MGRSQTTALRSGEYMTEPIIKRMIELIDSVGTREAPIFYCSRCNGNFPAHSRRINTKNQGCSVKEYQRLCGNCGWVVYSENIFT